MAPILDALFRQHLLAAQRPMALDTGSGGYETRHLAVGFVDLVGSTELGEQLSLTELGSLLTRFEHLASDTVTNGGGRVIKLIGDEVLFTAPDAAAAARIAIALAGLVAADDGLPAARAGLAHGLVMLRDGDVFGPVVNLAARIVGAAGPGEVLAPADLVAAAGAEASPAGTHALKGITGEVALARLVLVEG
jgi:adenylate cyclase